MNIPNAASTASSILFVALVLAVLTAAAPAAAQEPIIPSECRFAALSQNPGGCTICHLGVVTIRLTNVLMYSIALPAAVLLLVVGGFMLLISGASEQRRTLGRKILTSTLIGIIIVFLAWLGVDTIIKILTGAPLVGGEGSLFKNLPGGIRFYGFGPWNRIPVGACGI